MSSSAVLPRLILAAIVVVLIVAIMLYARRRRISGRRGTGGAAGIWPSGREVPEGERPWRPPQQPEPPAPPAGASLRVAIVEARAEGPDLLVSWNAVNRGTVPLRVQWSALEVSVTGEGMLLLRYTGEGAEVSGGDWRAPGTRLCGPGEVLSRSATLRGAATGHNMATLRVILALAYGAAEDCPTAQDGRESYLAWQQVAMSTPRPVQTAERS